MKKRISRNRDRKRSAWPRSPKKRPTDEGDPGGTQGGQEGGVVGRRKRGRSERGIKTHVIIEVCGIIKKRECTKATEEEKL